MKGEQMVKIGTIIMYDNGVCEEKMVVIGFNEKYIKVYNVSTEHNEIISRERLNNAREFVIQGDM